MNIVVDSPDIFDVTVEGGAKPNRKGGVRHEILPDGDHVSVREVWYYCDTGEEAHAVEVRLPTTSFVHMVVNSTEEERAFLATVRTSAPGLARDAWHRAPPLELPYHDEISAIVRAFVQGPPLHPPGSAAAGSDTEFRALERWRYELARRVEVALNRNDANTEGQGFLVSMLRALRSDRLVDQPSAVLDRVLA